jgi:hypothetical protein
MYHFEVHKVTALSIHTGELESRVLKNIELPFFPSNEQKEQIAIENGGDFLLQVLTNENGGDTEED